MQALAEHEVEIPETINTQTLVKDLAKEIRLVEVDNYLLSYLFSVLFFLNSSTKMYTCPLTGHLSAKHRSHRTSVSWFPAL